MEDIEELFRRIRFAIACQYGVTVEREHSLLKLTECELWLRHAEQKPRKEPS